MKTKGVLKLRATCLQGVIGVLGALCILFWGVLGCASSSEASRPVRLTFSTWGSAEELAVTRQLLGQFEQAHPQIKVTLLHIPENYFQKLHILIAGDLTPDVMLVNSFNYPVYAENHILKPLVLTPSEAAPFYPQALRAFTWQGKLYALPRDISNLVVFYNRDLFRQAGLPLPHAGWTWAEFLAAGQALTRDTDGDGKRDQFGFSFSGKPPLMWLPFVWSEGGDLFSPDLKHVVLKHPKAVAALQRYADLRHRWHVAPTKEESGNATMSQLFLQGQLAMLLSGRWTVPVLRQQADFQWDIAPFPAGLAGSKVGIDASGYAVAASSRYPEESQALVRFLTARTAQAQYVKSGLIVPARLDLAASPDFLSAPPQHAEVFTQIISSGVPTHVPACWNEFAEALQLAMEPVWEGNMSASQALQKAQPELERLLK